MSEHFATNPSGQKDPSHGAGAGTGTDPVVVGTRAGRKGLPEEGSGAKKRLEALEGHRAVPTSQRSGVTFQGIPAGYRLGEFPPHCKGEKAEAL